MAHPEITVSIVSYNTRQLLLNCLRSLEERQAAGEASVQIVVADNGSTDGTLEAVRKEHPRVQLLETGGNLGYGRANNMALQHSTTPFLLVLNSDTEVLPGALATMQRYLQQHPEAGAVGPQLLWPDGSPQASFGPDPSFRGIVQEQLLLDKILPRSQLANVPEASGPLEVQQLCGACSFIRATAYRQVKGFDPAYFMYHEDVDLNIRLRSAGWRLVFVPGARIIHHLGASSVKSWETRARMIRALNWSRYYYYHHHGSAAQGRLLKALFIAGAAMRLAGWSAVGTVRSGGREKVRLFRRVLRGAVRMKP